jgi:dCTP deaminase
MALSDLSIKTGLKDGEIIIHPFNSDDLGSASYDVRLGKYFYEARKGSPNLNNPEFYNIYSERNMRKVWGESQIGKLAADWKRAYPNADWDNIHDDDTIIMLGPHANLLCHTYEFIGARVNSTTMMKARSSIGRSLINVCQCAGMGDIGYFNRWTMEIYNRDSYHIPLVVHRRVAQIVFLPTGPSEQTYISKYQDNDNIDVLEKFWNPDLMLPRLDRDKDISTRVIPVEY